MAFGVELKRPRDWTCDVKEMLISMIENVPSIDSLDENSI